ncbi:ERMES complex subunit mmm1 [Elasticomyces elasticus]|nr:ERMES complex subunit mmm1 [Elasticomyces elasticus]
MSKAKQAAATAANNPQASGGFSFAQGFLVGQLTLALILFFFIKFFIFGEPPNADVRASTRAALRRQRTLSHHASLKRHRRRSSINASAHPLAQSISITGDGSEDDELRRKRSSAILRSSGAPLTTAAILAKTYYNTSHHSPESLDWFNVLIAQTIAQLRSDAQHDGAILVSLTNILNGSSRPDFLDEIRVTEISLGEEFPILSNCRVVCVDEAGNEVKDAGRKDSKGWRGDTRLQARMDVDLSDMVTLGIETKLVLNYPKPFVAVLPVALAVSVVRFSGTLSLSFSPSSSPTDPISSSSTTKNASNTSESSSAEDLLNPNPTTLTFTFLDDYRLDLSVHSLIGSRSRLQDVPKIAQLVEQRLHAWFDERCVEPRFQQIVLPSLWPRKRNTRGGETDLDGSVVDGGPDGTGDQTKETGRKRAGSRAGASAGASREPSGQTEGDRLAAADAQSSGVDLKTERKYEREGMWMRAGGASAGVDSERVPASASLKA